MADTLTLISNTPGVLKSFSLSTANTLVSTRSAIDYANQYVAQYGRVFNPTAVTISYKPYYPIINVFNAGAKPGDVNFGFTCYYDPARVPANTNQYKFGKSIQNINKMPAWLSALILPFV